MNDSRFDAWPARCRLALVLAGVMATASPVGAQVPFGDPQKAAYAFIDAVAASDDAALARLLGPAGAALVRPEALAAEDRFAFLEKSAQARTVKVQAKRADLVVGNDPWTMPIPIIQDADGQWRFNAQAGREKVLELRIGGNERAAIQAVLAYVDAQREYAQADRNGDGVLEYAQRLVSGPGRRDGLIWSAALGDDSPLGEDYLPARRGDGYHGYHYRILPGQGPSAPGGARSYLIGGRMTTGFALVAWPVRYGETGVMSFIVNQDGRVHERDLGPRTAAAAAALRRYEPDGAWKPVAP